MSVMGHQRRFKRKPGTSAYPLIADMLLRRTALPPMLAAHGVELR
jgi:hypothetical protein